MPKPKPVFDDPLSGFYCIWKLDRFHQFVLYPLSSLVPADRTAVAHVLPHLAAAAERRVLVGARQAVEPTVADLPGKGIEMRFWRQFQIQMWFVYLFWAEASRAAPEPPLGTLVLAGPRLRHARPLRWCEGGFNKTLLSSGLTESSEIQMC